MRAHRSDQQRRDGVRFGMRKHARNKPFPDVRVIFCDTYIGRRKNAIHHHPNRTH